MGRARAVLHASASHVHGEVRGGPVDGSARSNVVRVFERTAAYLPLLGTATILVIQNFFQDFLTGFRFTLALATVAISILLVAWFLEGRIVAYAKSFDELADRVRKLSEEQPKILGAASANFQVVSLGDAFRSAAAISPNVEHLRIFAASSSAMHTLIQHNKITADRCSLLIQRPGPSRQVYANDVSNVIERWKLLVRKGAIRKLTVYRYDFQPTEYQCILDDQILIHGLFDPSPFEDSGVAVRDPMVVTSQSLAGQALIKAFIERFETLFEYSKDSYGENDEVTTFETGAGS